jgi:phosphoribosyl 1,2-cyclic phosphodiesterase
VSEPRFAILGSGSKANAYIFEAEGQSFIIDNGFSALECLRRMHDLDFRPERVKFILLTHVHSDHIRGLARLSRKLSCPVYIHKELNPAPHTKVAFYKTGRLTPGEKISLDGVEIIPFDVYHDAPSPLGFTFRTGGLNFTLITDTGKLNEEMFKYAYHSNILLLESNYSPEMLDTGPYPEILRQRIRGDEGHLSNFDAGQFTDALLRKKAEIRRIYYCHLSENNNTPETAEREITSRFDGSVPFRICRRSEPVEGELS